MKKDMRTDWHAMVNKHKTQQLTWKNWNDYFINFFSVGSSQIFHIPPLCYRCTRMRQGERGQYFFCDSFRPQKTLILNVEMPDYPVKMNCTLEFHYCNHFFTHRHNAFWSDASLHNNAWFPYFLSFALCS